MHSNPALKPKSIAAETIDSLEQTTRSIAIRLNSSEWQVKSFRKTSKNKIAKELYMDYLKGGKTGTEEIPGHALMSYANKNGTTFLALLFLSIVTHKEANISTFTFCTLYFQFSSSSFVPNRQSHSFLRPTGTESHTSL